MTTLSAWKLKKRSCQNMPIPFNGVRWSSGSAFDCRSRGPLFESYTGLTWFIFWTKEINLWGCTRPICELSCREGGVCASLIFLGTVYLMHTKPGVKKFPRETRTLVQLSIGEVNVERCLNSWKRPYQNW